MPMNPRLLRPTVSGFDPRRIAGLVGWWDADDSSTITVSTGVSAWRDKVTGILANQAIGNNQPEYRLASVNNKNAVYFDGINKDLLSAANAVMNVTDLTFTVVFKPDATTSNTGLVNKSGINLNPAGFGFQLRTGGEVWFQTSDNLSALVTSSGLTTDLSVATIRATPYSQNLRLNAVGENNQTAASAYNANVGMRFGTRRNNVEFYAGYICEVLLWNRSVSDSERGAALKYLQRKWGLANI